MSVFSMDDLLQAHVNSGGLYLEFLKETSLSTGIYKLPAGAEDPQQPHTEDEVYYVIEGKADFQIGAELQGVETGTVIYVPANVEHRFQNITEDLTLFVFFAPAEYSRSQ